MKKSITHLAEHAIVIERFHFLAAEQLVHQKDASQSGEKHRRGGFHIDIVAQFAKLFSNAQKFRKEEPALHDEGAVEKSSDFRIPHRLGEKFSQKRHTAPVFIQDHAREDVQLVAQRLARHA